jgi:hypothetical protein
MRGGEFTIVIVALLLFSFLTINGIYAPEGKLINPADCYNAKGTVVDKEVTEQGNILYVEAELTDTQGYRVFVSNSTYDSYNISYTYERITCSYIDFQNWGDTLDNLSSWGVIEPY